MKNIVIFGAPGSGKGTQSDLMIEKYGFNHISTGDVLRSEIKNAQSLARLPRVLLTMVSLSLTNSWLTFLPAYTTALARSTRA